MAKQNKLKSWIESKIYDVEDFVDDMKFITEQTIYDFKELGRDTRNDFAKLNIEIKKDLEDKPFRVNSMETIERFNQSLNNLVDGNNPISIVKRLLKNDCPCIGDHLFVQRSLPIPYTHHGIYSGNNEVIHYLLRGVKRTSLEVFAEDMNINIVDSPIIYPVDRVVRRAESRLDEDRYNVISNNCEHFARWCRCGGHYHK